MSRKLSLLLVLILVISTLAAGCGGTPTARPTTAPKPAEPTKAPAGAHGCSPTPTRSAATFVMCEPGDAVRLDPADYDDGQTAARAEQIFETLVEFDGATTNVRPALAEKWETSADGKTWTFTLRKNVKFSDGTPFNADAALWNFQRQWDPKHPYHTDAYATLKWEYWNDVIGWGFKGDKAALHAGHRQGGRLHHQVRPQRCFRPVPDQHGPVLQRHRQPGLV